MTNVFPFRATDITPHWLEGILSMPANSISGIEIAPVGTGQVADSFRLVLQHSIDQFPKTLVVKLPSADAQTVLTAVKLELYKREVQWYASVASHSLVRRPHCYHCAINHDADSFILVLEDCAPAKQGDQMKGASLSQIQSTLNEAAKLHGAFLNGQNSMASVLFEPLVLTKEESLAFYSHCWEGFKERYQDRFDQTFFEFGEDFSRLFSKFLDLDPYHKTITHGDFRIDNLLFGNADERVVVLDWQSPAVRSPMDDVAYLIGTSVSNSTERRENEQDLFTHYTEQLIEQSTVNASFPVKEDELWREYRLGVFWGLITAVTASISVERTDRGDDMFSVMAKRPVVQAMDLESLSLL